MKRPTTQWEAIARKLHGVRTMQCIIILVNLVVAAYLAGYVGSKNVGMEGGLPVAVIMAGVSFMITGFGSWWGHHLGGYQRRCCSGLFITADLTCIGAQVAAIAVLAVAGLPWKCTGLTSPTPAAPDPRYDVLGFGDDGNKGKLDYLCNAPKAYFWLALILMISYIYTIGLSIRLIAALNHRAKELKAGRDNDQGNQRLVDGAVPAAGAVPISEPPPSHHLPQSGHAIPVPQQDFPGAAGSSSDVEAAITNGSWTSGGSTPAGSPPPYQPDTRSKQGNFGK